MPDPLVAIDVALSQTDSASRVSANVAGFPVWFETADAELAVSGEAFGSAFLIPAVSAGRELVIGAPTSSMWLKNADSILDIVSGWWGWEERRPLAVQSEPTPRNSNEVALCFTGGVDSFFTLLESNIAISTLVNVQGFDIPLSDAERIASAEADIAAVADALGLNMIIVRTNLREHPTFDSISWERTHGGALAAVGHLLRLHIGKLVVSSSVERSATRAWGSDWRLDGYFSSEGMTFEHYGEEFWRFVKLKRIANRQLVRQHLRVCWEHRSDAPNCSRCDKCLRTMITLQSMGVLDRFDRFDNGPISDRLRSNPPVRGPGNRREYLLMLEQERDPELAAALQDAIDRSAPPSDVVVLDA